MKGKRITSRTHVFSLAFQQQVERYGLRSEMHAKAAAVLQLSEATVRSYCDGQKAVPKPYFDLLRLYMDEKHDMHRQMFRQVLTPKWFGYQIHNYLIPYYGRTASNDSQTVAYLDRDELA